MELNEYRAQIDELDRRLIALLEQRFNVAAGIAEYKETHALPVQDTGREAEKLAAVRAQCRAETGDLIAGIFEAVLSASRAWQTRLREEKHG